VHWPLLQLVPVVHMRHMTPLTPHAFGSVAPSGWHGPVGDSQQLDPQLVESHTQRWPTHRVPAGHATHALPPIPHASFVVPARQEVPPLQQPLHDVVVLH
jgi:hypothetical protein